MRIINDALLKEFRLKTRCEVCKKAMPGLDPHHVATKGAGRLDIKINLISADRECHDRIHAGFIDRDDLIQIIADREGIANPSNIQEVIWMLKRLPKAPTRQDIDRELATLNNGARAIVLPILKAHTIYIIKKE